MKFQICKVQFCVVQICTHYPVLYCPDLTTTLNSRFLRALFNRNRLPRRMGWGNDWKLSIESPKDVNLVWKARFIFILNFISNYRSICSQKIWF